ncbi:ComF family protein [Caloramator sp. mosi_1]|uniref:ComF family protein n=1 Tax=Caloramator sp. mosi_1 TaxID=3023090 RepID=UPI0023613D77|nr:ComF family protein [Caloramator sp. mosi_1]WDC84876.1 ComF family protein [Caloramator sp. mosi_1]
MKKEGCVLISADVADAYLSYENTNVIVMYSDNSAYTLEAIVYMCQIPMNFHGKRIGEVYFVIMSGNRKYANSKINNKSFKQNCLGKGLFEKVIFVFNCLLDVIFQKPYMCIICGRELTYREVYICDSCQGNFQKVIDLVEIDGQDNIFIDKCRALYEFKGNVRNMVHDLKYKGKIDFAEVIAYLISKNINIDADLITWVPQSKGTYKNRGYNQSEEIAKYLSYFTGIKCEKLLIRIKETKTQVLLNGLDRWYNVCDAFATIKDLKGLKIVIVDDVVTTGATLNYCAKALKKSGADIVEGICFAKSC